MECIFTPGRFPPHVDGHDMTDGKATMLAHIAQMYGRCVHARLVPCISWDMHLGLLELLLVVSVRVGVGLHVGTILRALICI